MGNVLVKRHEGEAAPFEATTPLRAVRRLLGWDPFREMAPFFQAEEPALAFMPAFEIKETRTAYEFRADIPGVKESDIEITVTGNRLAISGSREAESEDKSDRYFATERVYGSFVRTFTLPEGIDANEVTATISNGVLTVKVPKKPETQPKKISVKAREEHVEAPVEEPSTEPRKEGEAKK